MLQAGRGRQHSALIINRVVLVQKNSKLWAADKISAAPEPMNKENINPDPGRAAGFAEASDARLGALLREASRNAGPALPPRFQEGVWRRIEEAAAPVKVAGGITWLDALVTLVLRPRLAMATAAMLMVAGALLGVREGNQMEKQDAEAGYLAVVAPN